MQGNMYHVERCNIMDSLDAWHEIGAIMVITLLSYSS